MENETSYYIFDDYSIYEGYNSPDRIYKKYDIESGGLGNSYKLPLHLLDPGPKPDCTLDEILTKQKGGLKPYYQEKLEYKIDGSDGGVYIEYEPGTELASTQKIEWLSPRIIEKINSCYESKKKAFNDKKEEDKKYLRTLREIDQEIENYKTKGHNFIL